MNCQEFENIIIDLARSQMMDAALRERGLAHTESCERCASRLADERALTAGLRALAASGESEDAPPRIEAALRAAFREPLKHRAVDDRAVATAAVAFIQPPTSASHWRRWVVAAAAAVLVALALIAQSWLRASSPVQEIVGTPPTPSVPAQVKPDLPAPQKINLPERHLEERPQRKLEHAINKGGRQMPKRVSDQVAEAEIVTEFFPLRSDASLTPQEGGHVVRVLMPHSALTAFGLPVNVERASEPVKADVVMGHDGLARAIRFVR